MARVFLSYSNNEKETVRRIADDLAAADIDVWLDEWEILPGGPFVQKAPEALGEADVLALALTPATTESGWVETEWRGRIEVVTAYDGIEVVSLLLAPCRTPPLLIARPRADFTEDYDRGLDALVARVRNRVADADAARVAAGSAPMDGAWVEPGAGRPKDDAQAAEAGPAALEPIPVARHPAPYQARLLVSRGGDAGLRGRWEAENLGASEPFDLALPMGRDDQEAMRWYLETYVQYAGAGDRTHARDLEERLVEWGDALYQSLFARGGGRTVGRALENALTRNRPGLVTIATRDPEVLDQPWEMVRNDRGPLGFQGVSIRRQLEAPRRVQTPALGLPLRVLLVVSRPKDMTFPDPHNNIAAMGRALEVLGPDRLAVDLCDPPTFGELEWRLVQARIDGRPYGVVHFDGQEVDLAATGAPALCFEARDERSDPVAAAFLGDLLAANEVPLVLVESLRGADPAERRPSRQVAAALLESGVGSVIAFSHAVHGKAARLFLERFYQRLVGGLGVGEALAAARRAMKVSPRRSPHMVARVEKAEDGRDAAGAATLTLQDWFVPRLYQAGDDLPLLPSESAYPMPPSMASPAPQQTVEERLHGFPPPPAYGFHGRAQELLELERAFRRHRAVLLHAVAGMGKTVLAREAAFRWVRSGRFEQAVFVSFQQPTGADEVVLALGRALEGEAFGRRDAQSQWREAVALFQRRAVLLVWDNFESTLPTYEEIGSNDDRGDGRAGSEPSQRHERLQALYRALTDGSRAGRLLVTCRPRESGLAGIREIALGGLARPDSLHLLAAITDVQGIATERPGYQRAAIERLLDRLEDHPLSIVLVCPHLDKHTPKAIGTELWTLRERFAGGTAPERRNQSLLASLEISKRRLGEETRALLPCLVWFKGGVFEQFLVDFAEVDPAAWAGMRAELVATALVRVEPVDGSGTPFLSFHPTLPFAAGAAAPPDREAAARRFIGLYLAVMREVDRRFRGAQPATGMALMRLEEANVRAALELAFRRGQRRAGSLLASTLQTYLERAGRLREHRALAAWVREHEDAHCAAIREEAWKHFTAGRTREATDALSELLVRLRDEGLSGGGDTGFQVAMTNTYLGRILLDGRRPGDALGPLARAVAGFEKLGAPQRANLADVLGDRANALRLLGRYDEALAAAEKGLALNRVLGRDREAALALDLTAQILARQKRYAEADNRYGEALAAASSTGDLGLQGEMLQRQGAIQYDIGHYESAFDLYLQALDRFRRAGDEGGQMRTSDCLGSTEQARGNLEAAAAWYDRSRELALRLGDRRQLAAGAHNLGILHQNRAERTSDPTARKRELALAAASVEEGLAIRSTLADQVDIAASYFQLGVLCRLQGALDRAETNARRALFIDESLHHPDVWKDYDSLAKIARARGDEAAAAEWAVKRDTELERRRSGARRRPNGEQPRDQPRDRSREQAHDLPRDQVTQVILALAQAAFHARTSRGRLAPEAVAALAEFRDAAAPFDAVGSFLEDVAGGRPLRALPQGVSPRLASILDSLAQAVRD